MSKADVKVLPVVSLRDDGCAIINPAVIRSTASGATIVLFAMGFHALAIPPSRTGWR